MRLNIKNLLIIVLIIVGIVMGIKNYLSKSKEFREEQIDKNSGMTQVLDNYVPSSEDNTSESIEETETTERVEIKDNDSIINALKERRFLSKNNIDVNSDINYVKVTNNIYLVDVKYKGQNGTELKTLFLASYTDGNILFDKLDESKSLYTKYIDYDNVKLKIEWVNGEDCVDILYDISNGKFVIKEKILKVAMDNNSGMMYTYNDSAVTVKKYNEIIKELNSKKYTEFEKNIINLKEKEDAEAKKVEESAKQQ